MKHTRRSLFGKLAGGIAALVGIKLAAKAAPTTGNADWPTHNVNGWPRIGSTDPVPATWKHISTETVGWFEFLDGCRLPRTMSIFEIPGSRFGVVVIRVGSWVQSTSWAAIGSGAY